jgi:alpha-D-ribose 1-methylphosphonate 5-triphosphate synthase subunit PhnH
MRRGLTDPVGESQAIFRAVLDAMAHPGRIVDVTTSLETPPALARASVAVCLALIDFETRLWLDPAARTDDTVGYLRFHCGAPIVEAPEHADFALVTDSASMPALDAFPQGTDEEPERSATVIVQVGALTAGAGHELSGPGIAERVRLRVDGVSAAFWSQLRDNHVRFPRGVDVMLVAGTRLAALPRTTRVGGSACTWR